MDPDKYLLIEAEDGGIRTPKLFDTKGDAYVTMLERFKEVTGYKQEDIDRGCLFEEDIIEDSWATCEKCDIDNECTTFNWRIVQVKENLANSNN